MVVDTNEQLLLTKKAILLHAARGMPISRQFTLEKIRDFISSN